MKTAEVMVQCLEQEGVRYIFGVPGEETMDFLEALSHSRKIQFIPTRHEQGAAFMADVWGRLTGTPGVCLSTLGPGATNLLTGVADAFLDHAPLVAITGQAGLERVHKESHQYLDIVAMFAPVTKWNTRVERGRAIPEVVRKAFRIASAEKAGPTHIELPEDVAAEEIDPDEARPLMKHGIEPSLADSESIGKALSLLKKAASPVILAGNGVIRSHAMEALQEFAHRLQIPVVHTFMGKGVISDAEPLSWGALGLQARDIVMDGLDTADLIVSVGYDVVEFAPHYWNRSAERPIIHIDTLPAEVDARYLPEIELVGNIGSTLRSLSASWKASDHTFAPYADIHSRIQAARSEHKDDTALPMKPQRILSDLRLALDPQDILISDVGAHKLWVSRNFPAYSANTVIISNGLASMGIAVPGAVAASLAYPDRHVVAVTGDGGFLMNAQELETARRLNLAFVTLVWTDQSYGVIEWKQGQRFGHTFGTSFTNPDFCQLAQSFGMYGARIEKADDLLPVLQHALSLEAPSLIEVPVDYGENRFLTPFLSQGK